MKGSFLPPLAFRTLRSSAGVAAVMSPSAEIHSAQLGSQSTAALRTMRMRIAELFGRAPASVWPACDGMVPKRMVRQRADTKSAARFMEPSDQAPSDEEYRAFLDFHHNSAAMALQFGVQVLTRAPARNVGAILCSFDSIVMVQVFRPAGEAGK
ncbi:hypothetical protein AB4037_17615 [Labrys sp. KB_33_2]|uniref:hypothetical protein n=1 Tax=unclassified Labrys (in: a-proteobacteria) TaxID=2688601 RepID=UPI003EBD5A7D